ncbi:InlB B-repeat-containing protein [Chitinispirillales bacterium ANBcel5]|uniref:InlB B-repeat-containing protein n=1 Tax=Cellulosispirillum alkaliphilum TaxID=3039283 RepID=UPI002A573FE6|nr:InlB B-repeat-containing protein [Chitinispirillales bacterium ANBcel5]
MSEKDVVLTAQWSPIDYNVTFNPNNGEDSFTHSVPHGTEIDFPEIPELDGHIFDGWYRDSSGLNKWADDDIVISDTSLYGGWVPKENTAVFYSNDGSNRTSNQTIVYGETAALNPNTFEREGYSFKGWSRETAANEPEYVDGEEFTMTEESIELFAVWEINSYSVTFSANNDTDSLVTVNVQFGDTIILENNFEHLGHSFNGWALSSSGDVEFYENQQIVIGDTDLKLYAVWTPHTYALTLYKNDGGDSTRVINTQTGDRVELENYFQRPGYAFEGWSSDSDGDVEYEENQHITIDTTDLHFYAVWNAKSFTLTFHKLYGSDTTSEHTIRTDEPVELQNPFEREGYEFEGWSLSEESEEPEYSEEQVRMWPHDVDLYAVWSLKSYTVTFDRNSDDATGEMSSQTIPYGTTQNLHPVRFSKPDWIFIGWSKSTDGREELIEDEGLYEMEANNDTLYAIWRAKPVMVSCGLSHTMLLFSDGTLWATGSNYSGQFGDSTNTDVDVFIKVKDNVSHVSAGWDHTMAITKDGVLWATGGNSWGQLGTGTTNSENAFIKIEDNVQYVTTHLFSTLVVKKDGQLYATGHNYNGELGLGEEMNVVTLTKVPDMDNVSQVSIFENNSMILKENGNLWATGRNGAGQLGTGDFSSINAPVFIDENVQYIQNGGLHTFSICNDGILRGTGWNTDGQLADGSDEPRNEFLEIDNIKNIKRMALGFQYSMILLEDGTLLASGDNKTGQLGTGDTDSRNTPVIVARDVAYVDVSAGREGRGSAPYYHTFIIKNEGTLWATGYNYSGQLGNGTTEDSDEFIQIPLDFYEP